MRNCGRTTSPWLEPATQTELRSPPVALPSVIGGSLPFGLSLEPPLSEPPPPPQLLMVCPNRQEKDGAHDQRRFAALDTWGFCRSFKKTGMSEGCRRIPDRHGLSLRNRIWGGKTSARFRRFSSSTPARLAEGLGPIRLPFATRRFAPKNVGPPLPVDLEIRLKKI